MKPLTSSSAADSLAPSAADPNDRSRKLIGEAIIAKGVVHGLGLVGGLCIKATKPDRLRNALQSQAGRKLVHGVVLDAVANALASGNITYGVKPAEIEAAIEAFLEIVAEESGNAVTRKVATGQPPESGQDGHVEYSLNYRGLPFSELHDSRAGSPSVNVHFVHAGETIAVLRPQVAAKPGTSVSGDAIKPPGEVPIEPSFDQAAGPNTQIDGQQLRAVCDGLYQEDDNGWIKIVPLIELDHVDLNTGRIPETGITEAAVSIKPNVIGGLGISSGEDLFVGGNVEGSAPLQARNLVVRGRVSASPDHRSSPIEATIGEAVSGIRDVTENVTQAATASGGIASEIASINRASSEIDTAVDQVKRGRGVGWMGTELFRMVGRFRLAVDDPLDDTTQTTVQSTNGQQPRRGCGRDRRIKSRPTHEWHRSDLISEIFTC